MNVLAEILAILQIATTAAQTISSGDVAAGANIAAALEAIAIKAVTTYQLQAGTPLDLAKLLPELPIQLPPSA